VRIPVLDAIAGTTLKATFASSGSTIGQIDMCLLDNNESVVSSVTPVSSGNGFYYAPLYVPTSLPWYVLRSRAIIGVNTYINRALVRVYQLQVD
jgi:hypothetical protein